AAAQPRHHRVGAAQSFTGGGISKALTAIAGSSAGVVSGISACGDGAKEALPGVEPPTLAAHGAVRRGTAIDMAAGAPAPSGAILAVAVTGIAGPSGGTEEKPVGTVWIAWKKRGGYPTAVVFHFDGDREQVRRQTVEAALHGLLELAA